MKYILLSLSILLFAVAAFAQFPGPSASPTVFNRVQQPFSSVTPTPTPAPLPRHPMATPVPKK
jgi:hypothetical protein